MALPRPDGHQTLTPAATVKGARDVITFIETAFGGELIESYEAPGGIIAHAEVRVRDCVFMLGDVMEGEPMPAMVSFYVEDGDAVDATFRAALDAGATSAAEPENQFYGYRSGTVVDCGGNRWTICAVMEDLTSEQIHERMREMMVG